MGNAPFTCKLGSETGVVGVAQKVTITINNNKDKMKEPTEVKLTLQHTRSKAEVPISQSGDLQSTSDSRVFTYTWTPTEPGIHKIIQVPVYPEGSNESTSKSNDTVQIFKDAAEEAVYKKQKADEAAEKARKEAQEKAEQARLDAEAKASGGIFSLDPKYKSVSEIPVGTTLTLLSHGKQDGEPSIIKIGTQQYKLSLGKDLSADEEYIKAIKAKLDTFASFPAEEERRPEKAWPADLTLREVYEGAVQMNDPYAIKQCLARGIDANCQFDGSKTGLAHLADCGLAKQPSEWKTHHGVSRNWSKTTSSGRKFQTYRQSRESDALACAILLLQAGAKVDKDVRDRLAKDNFFAKGVPKTRMNAVINTFHGEKKYPELDWTKAFPMLDRFSDDVNAEWPPAELLPEKPKEKVEEKKKSASTSEDSKKQFDLNVDKAAKLLSEMHDLQNKISPTSKQLEELWTCYDKDGNGYLDAKECAFLLQDLLTTSKNKLLTMLGTDPYLGEDAAYQMVSAQFRKREEDINAEGAVKRLLTKLDKDQDGRVDKSEFLAGAGSLLFAKDLFQ
jgi:Ca2+-binding EF-hand superfamily protein